MPVQRSDFTKKEIKGYEGIYTIDENGLIVNLYSGCVLSGSINSYGYRVVKLRKYGKEKSYKIHQLIAKAFIENPNNYKLVNHIDGNKLNNSVENLEWCNHAKNNFHARRVLAIDYSEKPVAQFSMDGEFVAIWRTSKKAADSVNGSSTLVSACCKGTAGTAYGYFWQYVDRAALSELLSN